jgi:hypothetical protein
LWIAEIESVANGFPRRAAARHSSYLDLVRFAEPDNLADDGIGAVRRREYGSHSLGHEPLPAAG